MDVALGEPVPQAHVAGPGASGTKVVLQAHDGEIQFAAEVPGVVVAGLQRVTVSRVPSIQVGNLPVR